MYTFVAEGGSTEYFMTDSDIGGSWRAAPAQLFLPLFLEALTPDMFRHACVSWLIVNDGLYTQPMDLFLIVEREAENWPRTRRLLVEASVHAGGHRMQEPWPCFCC